MTMLQPKYIIYPLPSSKNPPTPILSMNRTSLNKNKDSSYNNQPTFRELNTGNRSMREQLLEEREDEEESARQNKPFYAKPLTNRENNGTKFTTKQMMQIYQANTMKAKQNKNEFVRRSFEKIPISRILDKSCPAIAPVFSPSLPYLYRIFSFTRLPTISPQSPILLLWNFLVILCLLLNFLQIPISLSLTSAVYQSQFNSGVGLGLNIFIIVVLAVDYLVVRSRIGYYYKGKLVVDPASLWEKFAKWEIWVGAIGIVVLIIYVVGGKYYLIFVKLLFYIKLSTFFDCDSQILHSLQPNPLAFLLYRLSRLIITLFFLTSLLACIFFYIDYSFYLSQNQYYQNDQLWLTSSYAVGNIDLLSSYNWFIWYSYALYWAIQTSSTVGYGDLTPLNPPQVVYVILVILIMTILFAFYVNGIWAVLADFKVGYFRVGGEQIWAKFKNYLREKSISKQLKQRLTNTVYEIYEDELLEQTQKLLQQKISKQLMNQFHIQHKKYFYLSIPLFKTILNLSLQTNDTQTGNKYINFILSQFQLDNDADLDNGMVTDLASLRDLVSIIQLQSFSQDMYIYQEGQFDQGLYYVRKGVVRLRVRGSMLGVDVGVGKIFGEEGFFRRNARNHYAQTLTFIKVWKISYGDLQKVIQNNSSLKQHYKLYEHSLIFNPNPSLLSYICWKCRSPRHFMSECPQINSWQRNLTVSRYFGIPSTLERESNSAEMRRKNITNLSSLITRFGLGLGQRHRRVRYERNSKVRSVGLKNVAKLRGKVKERREGNFGQFEIVRDYRVYYPNFNMII